MAKINTRKQLPGRKQMRILGKPNVTVIEQVPRKQGRVSKKESRANLSFGVTFEKHFI